MNRFDLAAALRSEKGKTSTHAYSLSHHAVAGWIFSENAMKPVATIVNQVKSITALNLFARLETSNNQDELTLLVGTFNEMLVRLKEAFASQKYMFHMPRTNSVLL